ncbi:MAG: effector-associated domain EAD1-containing protein [Parvibaculaceae bacterium]
MPRLRPAQRLDLAEILKDAFPRDQMQIFLSEKLEKNISDYTAPDDDYPTAMRKIVTAADEEEWLQNLVTQAIAERGKNVKLQQFDLIIKWLSELHAALLARFSTPDSFQDVMAALNKNWNDHVSNSPYKNQLLEVIADAQRENWVDNLIDEVVKRSGPETKATLSDIKKRLVPASVSNLDVVFLGSALGKLAADISDLIDSGLALFGQHDIRALALKNAWTKEWSKQAELQAPRSTAHLIAIHCVDLDAADNYARHEDLLAEKIAEATGDERNVRRHVIWLPNGADGGAIAEKLRSAQSGYQSVVHYQSGSADDLRLLVDRWLGRPPPGPAPGLTPAFAYQPINGGTPEKPVDNIVEDVIIPKLSPQLQNKFNPPEWEKILFSQESEVRKFIEDLTSYPFGIVAINNFNGDVDREGNIPKDFQERITTLEAIIQDYIQSDKLKANNILRLAIIATTHPDNHLFQYPKGRNAIIARWRFVPVKLAEDQKPEVVGSHLNLLCEELRTRLNSNGTGTTH